jgi:hypothetical protein
MDRSFFRVSCGHAAVPNQSAIIQVPGNVKSASMLQIAWLGRFMRRRS